MSRHSVEIDGIRKAFGALTVLENISFDIHEGEFFSLLGPSGCGKTTLLRLIGGFEPPTSGRLLIDGQPVEGLPPEKRPTNTVFQSYALFPHLTVAENIGYGLRSLNMPKAEQEKVVKESLEMIRLSQLGGRKPHELSGGQRQRVALARALARRPKVLLLDEPLSALDKQLREEMQMELRRIQRQVGITFIFVTHDQEEALALSDRMAVMSAGRVLQIDAPDRIYEAPSSREVAAFIGSMNFFDGVVETIDGQLAHVRSPGKGLLKVNIAGAGGKIAPGVAVTVAVRPEKLSVGPADAAQINSIAGMLASAAYYGDRSHIHMRAADGTTVLVSATNAQRGFRGADRVGSTVVASFRPEDAILLPPTGAWADISHKQPAKEGSRQAA
ncbi:ABC transporter ATP-binding protein [Rhizobium sp. KVB221]|uniref:Spermidine/putrescine import ATP-binding protein PotA n=1 Tax=Rhizobium setariae TaxID=2801340 RepID=A0A936YUJ8_9HYPH|nr:ABC transporter ATP-binding protein [Rhizobium setariae]MBL0373501.1 ABC transporter ATP-binding protein [Rhizobium setariae]